MRDSSTTACRKTKWRTESSSTRQRVLACWRHILLACIRTNTATNTAYTLRDRFRDHRDKSDDATCPGKSGAQGMVARYRRRNKMEDEKLQRDNTQHIAQTQRHGQTVPASKWPGTTVTARRRSHNAQTKALRHDIRNTFWTYFLGQLAVKVAWRETPTSAPERVGEGPFKEEVAHHLLQLTANITTSRSWSWNRSRSNREYIMYNRTHNLEYGVKYLI